MWTVRRDILSVKTRNKKQKNQDKRISCYISHYNQNNDKKLCSAKKKKKKHTKNKTRQKKGVEGMKYMEAKYTKLFISKMNNRL